MGRMLSAQPMRAPVASRPASLNPLFTTTAPAPIVQDAPVGFISTQDEISPSRILAFKCAIAMLYCRMAVIPEVTAGILGVNLYLLYLVSPPAMVGCLLTGGFGRSFERKGVMLWTGFYVSMLAAVPFSGWLSLSATKALAYARTDLVCLYIVAGLILTWDEVGKTYRMLALSSATVLLITFKFAKPDALGRLTMDGGDLNEGTISNSNDLSAQILLTLPFLGWYASEPGRNFIVRYGIYAGMFYGLWACLGTSSRGAMLAMFFVALFLIYRANGYQRIGALIAIPVVAVGLFLVLPAENIARLATLFGVQTKQDFDTSEAEDSSASRKYLFEQSIKFTLENPLFGVGPANFSNYEGLVAKAAGQRGSWHETHNTWTQCSSECGIPALCFFVAGLLSAFFAVGRLYNRARKMGHSEIMRVCVTYQAAMVGYATCLTFLACAYRFTLPTMVGLGVAVAHAGNRILNFYVPPVPNQA